MTDDRNLKAELYQRAADGLRPAPRDEAPKSRTRALREHMEQRVEDVKQEMEERVRGETRTPQKI
jgi:hypothetical protein